LCKILVCLRNFNSEICFEFGTLQFHWLLTRSSEVNTWSVWNEWNDSHMASVLKGQSNKIKRKYLITLDPNAGLPPVGRLHVPLLHERKYYHVKPNLNKVYTGPTFKCFFYFTFILPGMLVENRF
jgi:hypothetical protein